MRYDCENIPCQLPDCDCEIDLDYIDEVQVPSLNTLENVRMMEIKNMTSDGEIEDIVSIAFPEESLLERIYGTKKFKNTGLGRLISKALESRRLGRAFDLLAGVNPVLGVINVARKILFKPNHHNVMADLNFKDGTVKAKQSKPKLLIANILVGLASAAVIVGLIPAETLNLSTDAAWVGGLISAVSAVWNYFDNKPTK